MTSYFIKINGTYGHPNEELYNAKKIVLKAEIKHLQTDIEKRIEKQKPTDRLPQELHTKILMLQKLELIPILHEMIENNCTVKELNDKVKEAGFARIDITIIRPTED